MPRPWTAIQPVHRITPYDHGKDVTLAILRTDDPDEPPLNLDIDLQQARELVKALHLVITGEDLCDDCANA